MTLRIDIPKMTFRYAYIWQMIREWYQPAQVGTKEQGEIHIISNRLAIYVAPDGSIRWFHICYPWKLYEALIKENSWGETFEVEDDRHFDIRWRSGLNPLHWTKCWCGKGLNKKEQMQIKLAVIGVKR